MKTFIKNGIFILILLLLLSCYKSKNDKELQLTDQVYNYEYEYSYEPVAVTHTPVVEEINIMLIDFYWSLSDGRYLNNQYASMYDWVGDMTPRVIFRKLEIPTTFIFYQERLRKERFSIMHQSEELKKLDLLENSFSSGTYDYSFNDNLTNLSLRKNGVSYGSQERVNQQENLDYPLIGVWGSLPNLTEYRLVDPSDCIYYMEIDKEIPFWAVRRGTYLLKQISRNTFETISSFPDGRLKLEIKSNNQIILTPLFTLPEDEEGLVAPLVMNRSPVRISELNEEENPFR